MVNFVALIENKQVVQGILFVVVVVVVVVFQVKHHF